MKTQNLKNNLIRGLIASCLVAVTLSAGAATITLKADTSKMAAKKMDKMSKMDRKKDHKTDDKMAKKSKMQMSKMKDTSSKM